MSVKTAAWVIAGSLALQGCGGNPFLPDDPGTGPGRDLPGTVTPRAASPLIRYEPTAEGSGNGYAKDFTYDAATDTYRIDNLAFDGDNQYMRGTRVATLGAYSVYEAKATEIDPDTGVAITQFQHRLIAGNGGDGRTAFAIVRTGAYRSYGFGGFVLKRGDAVTIPKTGQAAYSGDYAALRDFDGRAGLQYVTGRADVAIDFEDFNEGTGAVQGTISDRRIFNMNGVDITAQVMAAMDAKYDPEGKGPATTELPVLLFKVGPNTMDDAGELRGQLDSGVIDLRGERPTSIVFEDGRYYAILSGPGADQLVGIIVVTSEDPFFDGVTVRETGGFVLTRP